MNYYSFKLSNESSVDFVKKVEEKSTNIVIDQIYFFVDEIKIGDIVFINFGGDKVKWEKGLKGIARVSKEPYDIGYEKTYFRIQVDMVLVVEKVVPRTAFISYLELYDVAGIGPVTKGQQTQAISKLNEKEALLVARVLLDSQSSIESELATIFSDDQMSVIKGEAILLEPKKVKFGERIEDALPVNDRYAAVEKKFEIFMKSQLNKKKQEFADQTIRNYISSLRGGLISEDWIKALIPGVTNLFSVTDLDEIRDFKNALIVHENYYEFNKEKHHTPISSLIQYENFLETEGIAIEASTASSQVISAKRVDGGFNKIFYGSPGCGKSFKVKKLLEDMSIPESDIFRTTFYQEYSYTDFVGQIYPVIRNNVPEYEFVPGPFTLAFKHAILNPERRVVLVIEELNRGNAPSIFGDLFQLLDRYKDEGAGHKKGDSEYPIVNIPLIDYMNKQGVFTNLISFPSNFIIIATLNTSDQNVFTLDSAFKRRWESEKVQNKFTKDHGFSNWIVPGTECTWEKFVTVINSLIIEMQSTFLSSEDKQLGVYYFSKNELIENVDLKTDLKVTNFANKIFEYLWNDVAKFNRTEWFASDIKTLDELIDKYVEFSARNEGLEVFANVRKFE